MINGRIYSSSAVPRVCRSYLPRRCWKISRLIENDGWRILIFPGLRKDPWEHNMMIMDDLAFARFKYVQTSLNTFSGVWKSGDWCRFLSFGPKMAACGPSDWGGTLSQTWPQHLNYWIYRWFSRMFIWFSQLITFILYPSIDSYQGFSWIFRRCSSVFDDFPWLRLGDWWSFWPP